MRVSSGLYEEKTDAIAYYPIRNPGQFAQDVYDHVDREAMKLGYIIVQHHPHDGKSRHPCTEQLICTSKANVSTFSTVLFESMVAGVPAIQILPKDVESPMDYPNRFETAKEALDFINKNDLGKQNEWIKKHCVCDGNSTERFVEGLKEICNG